MTILQPSKSSQQGDSDEPPPKKKAKRIKPGRGSIAAHNVNIAAASSAPGPSQRIDYFNRTQFPTDHVIERFALDKFDVGIVPSTRSTAPPATQFNDFSAAGPSHIDKTQINNPLYLEYYIYGPGSNPNSKSRALKRQQPDVDLIEVISSEDIEPQVTPPEPPPVSDGTSIFDDINNYDFDDKFGEIEKHQQDALWEDSKMRTVNAQTDHQVASLTAPSMNGYEKVSPLVGPRTASLSNLGNTCFLNCVLYTLRYAPNFLHNLHHLVNDINAPSTELVHKKTASLGRSATLISKVRKDVYNGGAGDLADSGGGYPKTSRQIVTERLHEVYQALRQNEDRGLSHPYHPEIFLTALREVNPIFEGNQQQDAHELLVCLLDIFRETCQASVPHPPHSATIDINSQSISQRNNPVSKMKWMKFLKWNNRKNVGLNETVRVSNDDVILGECRDGEEMPTGVTEASVYRACDTAHPQAAATPSHNFVAQDFEGVMVLRTTCLECENMTEKKEPFADICVPIKTEPADDNDDDGGDTGGEPDASDLYRRAVVTDEFLRDRNKYYCEACQRYNEARRSVRYHRLPRLLTLQLKRFSSTYGAMSKVTAFMPTPMTLSCFCEDCLMPGGSTSKHGYELYAVIMHLGPNMAGGHYIAYVKVGNSLNSYWDCDRDWAKAPPPKPAINIFSKTSGSGEPPNGVHPRRTCRTLECCAVRGVDRHEDTWMACDDEIVKALTAAELEALLSKNSNTSNATPYLLFYGRRDRLVT